MSDLISREDAMAFPLSWEHRDKEHGSDEFIAGVECYRDYIEGLPSVQPDVARDIATIMENEQDMRVMLAPMPSAQPEIIRCKDCKYYGRADKRRFYRGMDCLNEHIDTIVPDKDFCSKAERKDNERA